MVFAKGRKPKARWREAVITAAKLRRLFSIWRSCHGLRTFLYRDGHLPVPESAALLPGNGGRIMRAAERAAGAARNRQRRIRNRSISSLYRASLVRRR